MVAHTADGSRRSARRRAAPQPGVISEFATVALLLLLAATVIARAPLQRATTLELGASDRGSVAGFYPTEINADDEALRWTNGAATIRLPAQGAGPHVLRLRLAAPQAPPPASVATTIAVNGRDLATLPIDAAPRQYRLLVPAADLRWAPNTVGISSPTVVPARDERHLGVAVFVAGLSAMGSQGWLVPAQAVALALAALALVAALARLGVSRGWRLLVVALFLLISLAMRQSDARFVERWSALALTAAMGAGFAVAALAPMAHAASPATGRDGRSRPLPPAGHVAARARSDGTPTAPLAQGHPRVAGAPHAGALKRPATGTPSTHAGSTDHEGGLGSQRKAVNGPGAASPPDRDTALPLADLGTWWRNWWPALALYAGLAAVLFIPIWPRFGTHIFGAASDNYEYAWKLHWFVEALVERGVSPTFVPFSFYPAGYELGMSEITPAHTLLGLPLTIAFGPAASFNSLVYLSYVLTGLTTALYAERIGASRLGALVAGVGVAFCVYRFTHMFGLLPQLGTQWVLLALYGWEGYLQRRHPGDAVLAAVGLGLAFWSSMYYGATLAPLLALYTLLRRPWAATRTLVEDWQPLLAALLIVTALVAPYAQPFLQAQAINEQRRFSYETLLILSALPGDFVNPNPWHPLRGLLPIGGPKQYVSLGIGLLALGAVGLWRQRHERLAWTLAAIACVNFVVALGPELRIGGTSIPLPVRFIHEHVPVLQSIRAWSRMAFYVQICVAALAALALTGPGRQPAWARAGALALAGLVLIEAVSAPPALSPLGPRAVDRWLAAQPGTGSVIQVPDTIGGYHVYYARHHHKPIAVGYGTYFPPTYHEHVNLLIAFPVLQEVVPLYQRMGVEWVLVRRARMRPDQPWRDQAAALPDVRQVYEDDEYTVFQVRQLRPPWRSRPGGPG